MTAIGVGGDHKLNLRFKFKNCLGDPTFYYCLQYSKGIASDENSYADWLSVVSMKDENVGKSEGQLT